jgi:uncharacterized membrane protein YqjE
MDPGTIGWNQLAATARSFGKSLLAIGENRLELWMVELQEERELLLSQLLLGLGIAAFGLLAGITFTAAVCILCWPGSPGIALLILAALYSSGAGVLYWKLRSGLRSMKTPSVSLEQLRKDRECLEKILR